jgi:hypothetical protein
VLNGKDWNGSYYLQFLLTSLASTNFVELTRNNDSIIKDKDAIIMHKVSSCIRLRLSENELTLK